MPVHLAGFESLPADRRAGSTRCRAARSRSSASRSSRGTNSAVRAGQRRGRHYLYDLGVDPDEQENRTGEPREAEMVELLRVALGELEAPVEHLERLGIA
ncbi:MAG: hypothetical protein R2705_07630 [Ilumatobacteraceae bacterium]